MGYDTFAVQDLIEEKGIVANDMDLLVDLLNRPDYVNPLKLFVPKVIPQYGGGMGGMGGMQQ